MLSWLFAWTLLLTTHALVTELPIRVPAEYFFLPASYSLVPKKRGTADVSSQSLVDVRWPSVQPTPARRMVAVVQTSLSALLNDATALEEVRLGVVLERLRAIEPPRFATRLESIAIEFPLNCPH